QKLVLNNDIEIVVFDDGSTDGTYKFVKENYPKIIIHRNEISKGYLYCRNKMLNETNAKYAISLDDDANFLSHNPLQEIENHFNNNPNCGLIAFRIFWGLQLPVTTISNENSQRVKGFVGCGHVWKIESWKKIPNYPEWFVFYGEEQYASYYLFKNNIQVHYLPSVLVHHRVDMLQRKNAKDSLFRNRYSLRSGWFLYFIFLPLPLALKTFFYSLFCQIKNKIFKFKYTATKSIILAIGDLIINLPKIISQRNKINYKDYKFYLNLQNTKIYWKPNEN
uniref:glycosyltransferase n=1 Tax=Flavobacterium sp. TaxID=239 RepID=UPI003752815E